MKDRLAERITLYRSLGFGWYAESERILELLSPDNKLCAPTRVANGASFIICGLRPVSPDQFARGLRALIKKLRFRWPLSMS